MRRRNGGPIVRFFATFWAVLQLASPGVAAIADGRFALDASSKPATHIEAATSDACPVVHAPDCAVCRYLSNAAGAPQTGATVVFDATEHRESRSQSRVASGIVVTLPHGRAPPTL